MSGVEQNPSDLLLWRPIRTAPKDGRMFLCWVQAVEYRQREDDSTEEVDVSDVDFCVWKPDGDDGYWDNMAGKMGDAHEITHWMPLPRAPQ